MEENYTDQFNNVFPKNISKNFLFTLETYRLFLEGLSLNPLHFFYTWSDVNRLSIADKYWSQHIKSDWKWSLSFPFFSLLEKYVKTVDSPKIIGFSGLPGSGKSTVGLWINSIAEDLNLDIKVISLDDFYLPGPEMDIVMKGNPWNVPRGFPGSHSIDLLNQSLETFLNTGKFNCPVYDKSLRNGKGDRLGWFELETKILILEGWFVGCEPISNLMEIDYISEDKFNLYLSKFEKDYRAYIQESLIHYNEIWKKFDKIWHLKSTQFDNTILWKIQQEKEMIKLKGSGLKDKSLNDFIRMIKVSIPQQSLLSIKSDTTILVNQNRSISNLFTKPYIL
tara:strand:+ start:4114 stop:5121 length:1008 start_codon:yes stop_codon:yes gene_type:complete